MQKKREGHLRLTTQGVNLPHFVFIVFSFIMVLVSVYMTKHYFETVFPEDIGSMTSASCNFSKSFNCDITTLSPLGSIFGIPTALFGGLVGVLFLLGSLFPSENFEQNNFLIAAINLVLSVLLFLYSLIFLKGLCPVCCIYYLCSIICFWAFFKYSDLKPKINFKIISIYAVFALSLISSMAYKSYAMTQKDAGMANILFSKYKDLEKIPAPTFLSPFKLNQALEKNAQQAVDLYVFSDFQCPGCKVFAESIPHLIRKFKDYLNVYYYFYPLDPSCNSKMDFQLHPMACNAANLAACGEKNFIELHDEIFSGQNQLSDKFLEDLAQKHSLQDCYLKKEKKDLIQQSLQTGETLGVQGTPALFIDRVKINALLPLNQLTGLVQEIIASKKAK